MITILPGFGRTRLQHELVAAGLLTGVEIGVQAGEHAETLLLAGVQHLTLVDLWAQQPDYFDIANVHDAHHLENLRATEKRMAAFPGRVVIRRGASVAEAALIPDAAFDFVYIDANHNLAAVTADLAAWAPKVRPGGWVCGHDFMDSPNCCGSEFGVATAVQNWCMSRGVTQLFVCPDECFPNWHFVQPG